MVQFNVLEYLEQTVLRVPQKIAFTNEEMGITFDEVYTQSRAIGTYLYEQGIYKQPVVVFMKRHPKAIVAFFGTVYGGNFYVPIDEEMPRHRIELIIENVKPPAIICDETTQEEIQKYNYQGSVLLYDELIHTPINEQALKNVRDAFIDTDPLYIVFTSGSTGMPKGVVANHRSVIEYIENLSEVLGFNEQTVFGN